LFEIILLYESCST
jgi:integrase